MEKNNILGINGSASPNSSNLTILQTIKEIGEADLLFTIIEDLSILPHFRAEQSTENTPQVIIEFRQQIEKSDGIIIVTPEYVFSIPSRLKNAIEWCVSETVFSDKPVGLITASASGEKGQEELKLIMKTVQATFTNETTLLIQGAKGKTNIEGETTDKKTYEQLENLVDSFITLIDKSSV